MQYLTKKITNSLKVLVLSFVVCFLLGCYHLVSAGAGDNLTGWAWSDNIGWISMNSTNDGSPFNYGVALGMSNFDSGGVDSFSGYAWSDNIGWIAFDRAAWADCPPSGPCANAQVDWSTGQVTGWAKALAGEADPLDGWDGWISLSNFGGPSPYGVSVDTTTGDFSGFAWGDVVVGWVDFTGVVATLVPQVTLTPDESNPTERDDLLLTWTVDQPVVSCVATGDWPVNEPKTPGNDSELILSIPAGTHSYTLTCTDAAGNSGSQTTVVTAAALPDLTSVANIDSGVDTDLDGNYDTFTINYLITSNGGAAAGFTNLIEFDFGGAGSFSYEHDANTIGGLGPAPDDSGWTTVTYNPGNFSYGGYQVCITADMNTAGAELIDESDELNNTDCTTGTIPVPDPGIDLTANPSGLIRQGTDVDLTWDIGSGASYLDECVLGGPKYPAQPVWNFGDPGTIGVVPDVGPLTTKSEFVLQCTTRPSLLDGSTQTFSDTVELKVTEEIEER